MMISERRRWSIEQLPHHHHPAEDAPAVVEQRSGAILDVADKSGGRLLDPLPALAFLAVGLVVPAVRTVVLSFQGGRNGEEGFTLETWTEELTSDRVISFQRVGDIFTSRLFLVAVALGLLGIALGARAARRSGPAVPGARSGAARRSADRPSS